LTGPRWTFPTAPERRCLSVTSDLGGGASPGAVAFDCDHLNAFTAIGIIGGKQARGSAHPTFAGEYVSVDLPATKAVPQRRACSSLCVTIRPIRKNLENLTVGYTLKFGIDASGALELSADAAERALEVLIKRGCLQLHKFLTSCSSRLSAFVAVGHDVIAPSEFIFRTLMPYAF
jgi:hypothetical protein